MHVVSDQEWSETQLLNVTNHNFLPTYARNERVYAVMFMYLFYLYFYLRHEIILWYWPFICSFIEVIMLKTPPSCGSFYMQLFSSGWGFSSQSVSWKDVEVRMYALSRVSISYLLVIFYICNYCRKIWINIWCYDWC
jgi:hypothetical protein